MSPQQALCHAFTSMHGNWWRSQSLFGCESMSILFSIIFGNKINLFFLCSCSKIGWQWKIWIYWWCCFVSKLFLIGGFLLFLAIFFRSSFLACAWMMDLCCWRFSVFIQEFYLSCSLFGIGNTFVHRILELPVCQWSPLRPYNKVGLRYDERNFVRYRAWSLCSWILFNYFKHLTS